jgi:hypothetical protein
MAKNEGISRYRKGLHRPFPFKANAQPGRRSNNAQNKLKRHGRSDRDSKISFDLFCLADKGNRAAMGGWTQKKQPHSENNDEGKGGEKRFASCWDCKSILLP